MIIFIFSFYLLVTVSIIIYDLFKYRRAWYDPLYIYMVAVSLYVLPLSLRYIIGLPPTGNVTHLFYDIQYVYPYALFITALSNIVFYITYLFSFNSNKANRNVFIKTLDKANFKLASIFVFLIGLSGFLILVKLFGGFRSFLLAGYGVTEKLSENPAFATAIPVLFVSSFIMLATAHKYSSKKWFVISIGLFSALIILNLLLGRRAEIASWGLAGALYYCTLFKYIKFKKIFPLIIIGFLLLNFIGIVRQAQFDSFNAMFERVQEKQASLNDNSDGLFYTLVDGQFAVPYEVLPVLMEFDEKVEYKYGSTLLEGAALWVPRFIWPEKPYGLASWYYRTFYDPSAPPNEGRQFFFLAEGYLNFGLFGVLLWAFLSGAFWKWISRWLYFDKSSKDNYLLKFTATIFVANIHKLIAASSGAILVTLPKQTIIWFIAGLLFSLISKNIWLIITKNNR